jgi:O-antigen/teichoic acid export membrane protein
LGRRFSINVFLNIFGTVSAAVIGFVTLPFLVKQLGSEGYGLWTLAVMTTGAFAAFDLGIAASVGRLIAGKRAEDDIAGISAVASSAMAGLILLSLLTMGLIGLLIPFFPRVFHVPSGQLDDVRRALLLLGLNGGITLVSSLFNTFLSSYERFDLENLVDIGGLVLRAALTFTLVQRGASLTELAVIITSINVLMCVAYSALAFHIEPRLRLRAKDVTLATAKELLSFGLWYFVMIMLRVFVPQIAPTTIGVIFGNSAVTTYAIARQLVLYSSTIVVAAARTATPRAAMSHFAGRSDIQRALFMTGGRWMLALSLVLSGGLLCLGEPLLMLWQGGRHNDVYIPLVILVVGEIVPTSQWLTSIVLTSIRCHRGVACLIMAEGLFDLVTLPVMATTTGLVGVCLATSLGAFVFRGFGVLLYGCRRLATSIRDYLYEVWLAQIGIVLATATFYLCIRVTHITGLVELFAYGSIYGLLILSLTIPSLLGRSRGFIWTWVCDTVRSRSFLRTHPRSTQESNIRFRL